MTAGEKFKQVRTALGLNQKDFASKIDMKQSSYNMIENGKNNPTLEVTTRFFTVYDVNTIWFFQDKGVMFSTDAETKIHSFISEAKGTAYYAMALEALALLGKFVLLESKRCKEVLNISDTELKAIGDHTLNKYPFSVVSLQGTISLNDSPFFTINPPSND